MTTIIMLAVLGQFPTYPVVMPQPVMATYSYQEPVVTYQTVTTEPVVQTVMYQQYAVVAPIMPSAQLKAEYNAQRAYERTYRHEVRKENARAAWYSLFAPQPRVYYTRGNCAGGYCSFYAY